jgi:hypothetical protein
MSSSPGEARSVFASTTGGVMTEETGAVTGELELATRMEAGRVAVRVRYTGAEEWYTVKGSPLSLTDDMEELHGRIVDHLRRPGPTVAGNEEPVSLYGLGQPGRF